MMHNACMGVLALVEVALSKRFDYAIVLYLKALADATSSKPCLKLVILPPPMSSAVHTTILRLQ